jgi:hypothetical protein
MRPSGSIVATLLAVLGAGMPLTGCEATPEACLGVACGPCGPPIEVTVIDGESEQPVAGAVLTVTRTDGVETVVLCGDSTTETRCAISAEDSAAPSGTYGLAVEATGYVPAQEEVVVAATELVGCCSCGYLSRDVTIGLQRE